MTNAVSVTSIHPLPLIINAGTTTSTSTRDAVEASFLEQRVVLDLADSGTIVSLLLLRRCIRKIGTRYNLRMDGFSMAFFAVGVLFVGTLLIAHKELLQMADLQVGYEEEVVDPVTVLGRPASMLTVGATLSAIFTGFVIAVQGWIGHRGEGWDYSDVDGVWRPPIKMVS
eukprot:g19321.t1